MQVFTYPESKTYTLYNTFEHPVIGLKMWGNSVQDTSTGGEPAGKNLLNISADLPLTAAGVTISRDSEGNIILNGTATSSYTFTLGEFNLPYNTYTLSINSKIQGVGIDCKDFAVLYLASTTRAVTVESSGNNGFYCNISSGITFDNFILNPQIEIGSTATTYEPYIGKPTPTAPIPIESVGDDGSVGVTACGKNILFQTSKTETINGITFTPQKDGSILMNGTSTGDVVYNIYQFERTDKPLLFEGGEYTISFGNEVDVLAKNNPGAVFMVLGYHDDETDTNTYPVWKNEGVSTFSTDTLLEKRNFIVRLRMYTGVVCDNVQIYPQIERGTTATVYEPYKGNTATITSGLPLCSVGEYRDELVYNADGTGKIVKRIRKVVLDGSEANWIMYTTTNGNNRPSLNLGVDRCIYGNYTTSSPSLILCDKYKSVSYLEITTDIEGIGLHHIEGRYLSIYDENFATASIDEWKAYLAENPLTVIYALNTPQEIELSAAEMAVLMELQTYDGMTNIFNSDNAEMQITFLGGQEMETNIDGFWDSEDGDRKYSAADFVGFFQDFFTNGIVAESTTYLQVMAKEGLTVRVNVGKAYINGGFFKPKTVTDLNIEDSDTTNPRYDMVVLRWDATIKKIYLDIVKGTPAATPSVPALTRNEIVYELGLARIYVAANTLQITQANITDLRFNSSYCGVVKGVIDTIDTTDLFAQYEKAWIDFVAQLGDSDHVVISTIDEEARADVKTLETIVAEHTATLKTNAPYKILTGSGTASGGSTSITFETAFKTVPVVIVAPYSTSTTAARACTCHLSAISATGFTVKTYTVTGATSANVENTGIGFRWVAFGT